MNPILPAQIVLWSAPRGAGTNETAPVHFGCLRQGQWEAMTAPNFLTWIAASLLLAAGSVASRAQDNPMKDTTIYVDNTDHDLQFFAPVDFDFDNEPIRKCCGFSFSYDKLSWAFTGERTIIGVEGATYNGNPGPFRVLQTGEFFTVPNNQAPNFGTLVYIPAPYYPATITNSAPRAKFAWGERYELGYFEDNQGISIGILDGPQALDRQVYGFGWTGQYETVATGVGLPTQIPNNPNNQLLSPLGSVQLVFEVPLLLDANGDPIVNNLGETLTLAHGFLDVQQGAFIDGVPGRTLQSDSDGDGVLDGDGFADDIDGDSLYGPDGSDEMTPGQIPDTFYTGDSEPDMDDLVALPLSFHQLTIRNVTQLEGIELMHSFRLSNRHRMVKHQNNMVEFSYGVRYLRLRDQFIADGLGGTLGESFWDTVITNNLVGPQVALRWTRQKHRIQWDLSSRCLLGYNIQNWEQTAAIGEDFIPGELNHPLYLQPTYSTYGKQVNDFSPLVELRLQASYQITSALAARLGYTATFVDNIARASQQVRYRLPEMGFRTDGGTQEIFISGVNFGFEAVY